MAYLLQEEKSMKKAHAIVLGVLDMLWMSDISETEQNNAFVYLPACCSD